MLQNAPADIVSVSCLSFPLCVWGGAGWGKGVRVFSRGVAIYA